MIVGRRVRLKPTKAQENWLKQYAGVSRFVYNYSLGLKIDTYNISGENLGQKELMRNITDLKYTDDYLWLQNYNSETIKQSVKDMLSAYNRFFNGLSRYPKFKKRGKCKESFYVRYDKIYSLDDRHIKLPNLKEPMKISESLLITKGTIKNPRVAFDGKYWYLSYSFEVEPMTIDLLDEILGVDLGIKDLAIVSNGDVYSNINKSDKVIKLEKKLRILQRRVSRAYEKNSHRKTRNIIKMERKLRLLHRRLKNIRQTYIHQITYGIVKTKPSMIVLENLGISNMMKNRHFSKSIQNQSWYFFRQCIQYKSEFYGGINVLVVPRAYLSSKLCSRCGNKKHNLKLKDRVYACSSCGLIMDRDLNASINLRNYGLAKLDKYASV